LKVTSKVILRGDFRKLEISQKTEIIKIAFPAIIEHHALSGEHLRE